MNSVNELNELREQSRSKVALREGMEKPADDKIRLDVLTCGGTGCHASNSDKIIENLKAELVKRGIQGEVNLVKTGCFGLCQKGPIMAIFPDNIYYCHVKPEDAERIVEEHIVNGPFMILKRSNSMRSSSVLHCATAAESVRKISPSILRLMVIRDLQRL